MKVFKLTDKDYEEFLIASENIKEAIKTFEASPECTKIQPYYKIEEIVESKWSKIKLKNMEYDPKDKHLNWKSMSIKELMQGKNKAQIIRSSIEY